MINNYTLGLLATIILFSCTPIEQPVNSLKTALSGKFLIGTALNKAQIDGTDSSSIDVIKTHFNSIVAENCMKSEVIQPQEGVFNFELADQFVAFGEANNMFIIGHTLVWHSQAPDWFFVDDDGNDVTREVLIKRMKTHIEAVVSRYKGRVHGWDVVNEAILDDGSWRESKFYKIIGEDYLQLAFKFAHEADPLAELYYNDYSMVHKGKRNTVVDMVKLFQAKDIAIHGIGMQTHCSMNFPTIAEFEKSILAFSETGVNVMITEMDISILPTKSEGADIATKFEYDQVMNPFAEGLPDSAATQLHNHYLNFFKLFIKHSDKITRVTTWGVNDAQSWRNYWPIDSRTDYPLLFDRDNNPKPIVQCIIDEGLKTDY